jgi:hypothetical protein
LIVAAHTSAKPTFIAILRNLISDTATGSDLESMMWPERRGRLLARKAVASLTKQLCSMGAKAERYERHRKRHWQWSDPRQLKLPFNDGDGQ